MSQFNSKRKPLSNFFFNTTYSSFTYLSTIYRDVKLSKFLWTTYNITDTIGGPSLTCDQQNAGASSEDNIGQHMDKGH